MSSTFDIAVAAIIDAGRRLDARGWAMGGAGNYSVRLEDGTLAVTVSGRAQGPSGACRRDARRCCGPITRMASGPRRKRLAHVAVDRARPVANAVLHTHSGPAVVSTRLDRQAQRIGVAGYEMLKALPGFDTHEDEAVLPVLDNDQDMDHLSARAEAALRDDPRAPAFLIRDHGLYAWAASMHEAMSAAEGLEQDLACELETRRCEARSAT